MARRKKHNINDIAAMAGCSIGTVSRATNGFEVNPETKEKIDRAIQELDYVPPVSRRMASGKGKDILILVTDKLSDRNAWTQMVLFNIMRQLGEFGYRSRIEFRGSEDISISPPLKTADACIVWGRFKDELYQAMAHKCRNLPVVSYSREIPYQNAISVFVNDENAMNQLVSHLLAARHNKIAYIANAPKSAINKKRYEGFVSTMKAFGYKINQKWLIHDSEELPDGVPGYNSTMKLMRESDRPTAVIYNSDFMAIGGMEALKQSGCKVPGDVSVVSFDDLPASGITFPPLTTMRLDTMALGAVIVESLEKLILGRAHERNVYLDRQLVQRKSVAVCNA